MTTDKGEEVISNIKINYESIRDTDIEFNETDFERKFSEFWDTFPVSDKYLGFPRTRVLRSDQEHVKKKYKTILKEYSHEDVMKGLITELQMRKRNSIKDNDLKYMKSVTTWLNQKEFIAILDGLTEDGINENKVDLFSRDV